MSNNHVGGNIIPEITREEHDGDLNAKRVSLVSTATIYAVVQTNNLTIGTTPKTTIHKTVEMSTSSVATIAVPTGGNAIFYTTNILLNSDATVRLNIKSGATYLTGNASIGVTLMPGGGWVESGAPMSPTYIGLASGAAIVLEKLDLTATSAKISGKIHYFSE